jgi:transcription termination/antitermination protein NusG
MAEKKRDTQRNLEQSQGKKWYIVKAISGKEHQVMRSIADHARLRKLENNIGEMTIPVEEVVEMKGGKKRRSERKFFPGYVLVEMEMSEEMWHLIRHVPGVLGFVGGTNDKPTPLTEKEVNSILQRVQEGVSKPKPKTLFAVGEVVRIINGPFADFDGVVEDINYDKSRLRVSVSIFGRPTPVELEFGQVQKS